MDDDKWEELGAYKCVQYRTPPIWMEMGAYLGALGLFSAGMVLGNIYFFAALCGMVLYWNYTLFRTLHSYVKYVNANEFKNLMATIKAEVNNKQKDGTFQDSSGLTKEQDHNEDGESGDR